MCKCIVHFTALDSLLRLCPYSDFAPDPEIEKPRNQNYHFSDKHTNLEMDIEIEFDNFCLT
jgi:hypothetical protein